MRNTKVKEVMTAHPTLISPDATLQEAAQKMEEVDCGILPVGKESKLEGMITDRDIVIRAISRGKNPAKEKVKDFMSRQVYSCKAHDTLIEAATQMNKHNVSRLIVKDDSGRVSGILSFGCILRKDASADEIVDVVEHARGKACAA
ncbi:MAG: CBS domain-containing protein [Rickettsiales bacterium]|nr:CBS domain-containing protein [Rickettsiales bacterium]